MDPISAAAILILNDSIITATYSDAWKHVTVLPFLKKPSLYPKMLANYRPFSLLPYPTKVMEKMINKRLATHLNDNHLHDTTQSGFRPNHSTENALIAATDDIQMIMDRGGTAAIILLDLSTAFNTDSHSILIQ